MGKITGFLEYDRQANQMVDPQDRIKNYDEFYQDLSLEERKKQAARCMNCGVPLCQSAISINNMVTGCPLHNLIPEFNDEIYKGNMESALSRLLKTNPFPEFTGRVCPALCEKACINGYDGESVTIHDNEKFIIEEAFKNNRMTPKCYANRSGKKVAVIGSGPSGLAVAHELNKRGHTITVYEREDHPGGLLMYGIPNMKLDKQIVKRRIDLMQKEGITFICSTNVGKDIPLKELKGQYDAIVLCCGSKQARKLNVENEDVKGIYPAVDFLTVSTKAILKNETSPINAKNKYVIIVGGGDTGNDCAGTVMRQGAKAVTQLEMMSKPSETRLPNNPWPEWPKVLKTDYGQQEVIYKFKKDPRIYNTTIKQIHVKKDHIASVITKQVEFKDGKLQDIPNSEKELKCDLLLIAAGFTGIETYIKDTLQLSTTPRNTVATLPNSYKTKDEQLFVCGDARRGQSLVVWAIAEGKACAKEVDLALMQYTNLEG